MNMNTPPDPHDLERLVSRVLRDQPSRQAPPTLANRVMAELAYRASLPWWRKSFSHWPWAARIAFVAISLGLVKVALTLTTHAAVSSPGASAVAHATAPVAWLADVLAIAAFSQELLTTIMRAIPSLYLYGVMGLVVALYLMVFGVSAAAYRTLNFSR
jgi:hypothetical protein